MALSMKKCTSLALTLIMSVGILSGCGSSNDTASTAGKEKDTIVYGISTSPSGVFNPLLTDSVYDDAVCEMVYSSLLKLDNELNLKPSMAEKYEISPDQKTITFKLKKNLKWSDGKPLTSKDVAFTFKSLASKDYQGEHSDYVSKVQGVDEYKEGKADNISGIKTPDESTIELTFAQPYDPALTNLGTTGIIPEHIWSKVPENKWKESKDLMSNPVGSGPFKMVSFTEGQDVKFEKNKDFFGGEAKTDKLVLKVISEDTVASDLKNGDIDLADVTNLKKADVESLEKDGFKTYKHQNTIFQYMGLNYRNPIFKDIKVREAMLTAIDRQGMVDKLIEGNGEVKNVPMLSSSWAYPKDAKLNEYKYDKEKAKKLLNEAGYTEKDGVMTNAEGQKLSFKLDVPTGNSVREQTAQIIQENLKEVGIKVELNKMEFPALMEKVVGNHEFDMYMMGNNLSVDPDLTAYWSKDSVSDKKGEMGWNISGFTTPELDQMLAEGAGTTDKEARKVAYKKFAEYMNEQIPWMYLFEQNVQIATNPKLEGFNPSVFRDFAEAENWKLAE
ncbi:MAG: ABC transporter substrate-binding protein [Peptostreptococcus sp.]|uniref:ABC transporter substrate-binding protein n=1 Tax=Peptostreptococcus sp. TaxID=1262 RepID=UPI002FCB267F